MLYQVVASLLVTVVLLGYKISAWKRLLSVNQRRRELNQSLALLQPKLENEETALWINDVAHDSAQRQSRIDEMALQLDHVYSTLENEAMKAGEAMFAVFESNSAGVKQLKHSAVILCSETKLDEATGLLLGRGAAMIRAAVLDCVAYMLNYDSRHIMSVTDKTVFVRCELLEHANAHHTIIFNRAKTGAGLRDRTFLNSMVAKRVAGDLPAYMVVGLPIAHHAKITRQDEKGAVRAENCRSFRFTEVAPGITKVEYTCALDLRGSIPRVITNTLATPGQMHGTPRLF